MHMHSSVISFDSWQLLVIENNAKDASLPAESQPTALTSSNHHERAASPSSESSEDETLASFATESFDKILVENIKNTINRLVELSSKATVKDETIEELS